MSALAGIVKQQAGGGAPPVPATFVESQARTSGTGTSHTVTLTNYAAGDLVVVAGMTSRPSCLYTGGTVHANVALSTGSTFIASRVLPAEPSATVEITTSANALMHFTAMVFRSANGTLVNLQSNPDLASSTSGALVSTALTLASVNVAVMGFFTAQSNDTDAVLSAGWTTISDTTTRTAAGYRLNGSGTDTPSATWTTASVASGVAASFS
jgi:hypothetical protein